ncbi:DNA repair and recombination protein RAD54 [Phytophthora cinnamomi]|uniref:DNA repair and recombination protein RAD54 n=1 Tax=Phytophthora cinnamomi TaxID=4785 RepID=UPI00355A5AE2|nr:DNA repair and recombination protein RAD54 [Phytophthora cinnamomi]
MLRRRPAGGGGAKFKPFVLPVKSKPARAQPQEEDEDAYEDADAASNRQALRTGASLSVKRLPFLSFLVMEPERRAQHVRRPFKSPCGEGGRTQESNRLLQTKTLGMRRRWGSAVLKPMVRHDLPPVEVDVEEIETPVELEPQTVEEPPVVAAPVADAPPPLVLWQSESDPEVKVVVPEIVGKFLRPHQREGVQFMFDCVCQVRGFDGQGCILADDMGLGKTLQSITLMYTLLMTGMNMQPTVKRAIVVCPTSLVKNWDDEIIKWLHGRVKTVALYEAKRETVIKGINQFIEGSKRPRPGFSAQVLIISTSP